MNYCGVHKNGGEEVRNFVAVSNGYVSTDRKDAVVCPTPRRVVRDEAFRPQRWHLGHHSELSDSRGGSELLDIILSKGVHGAERSTAQVASPPPFFCGSPPSRVSNPLIQDVRFKEEIQVIPPFSPLSSSSPKTAPLGSASSPNSSSRKSGCVRADFGNNPAVRVEGFDCLDMDRRNCSILTLA